MRRGVRNGVADDVGRDERHHGAVKSSAGPALAAESWNRLATRTRRTAGAGRTLISSGVTVDRGDRKSAEADLPDSTVCHGRAVVKGTRIACAAGGKARGDTGQRERVAGSRRRQDHFGDVADNALFDRLVTMPPAGRDGQRSRTVPDDWIVSESAKYAALAPMFHIAPFGLVKMLSASDKRIRICAGRRALRGAHETSGRDTATWTEI
jgi:hypothetical protein